MKNEQRSNTLIVWHWDLNRLPQALFLAHAGIVAGSIGQEWSNPKKRCGADKGPGLRRAS